MTVYVEYAFLENFLLDFLLLRLAIHGGRERVRFGKIALGAMIGGIFAVVYPLLYFPEFCRILLKIAVGALMCALSFGKIRNKNAWGRYAFTVIMFFIFSFSFAGGLHFFGATGYIVFVGFGWFFVLAEWFIRLFYRKKRKEMYIYTCKIGHKGKKIEVFGFFDTGNLARYADIPVCFLDPNTFYELYGEAFLQKCDGQVRDEMRIYTVSGEKRVAVYAGTLWIEGKEKEVYFALGAHIVNKSYSVLLNGAIFEDGKGTSYEDVERDFAGGIMGARVG